MSWTANYTSGPKTKSRKKGLLEQYHGHRKNTSLRIRCLLLKKSILSGDSITVHFPDSPDHEDSRRWYITVLDSHNGLSMGKFLHGHLVEYVAYRLSRVLNNTNLPHSSMTTIHPPDLHRHLHLQLRNSIDYYPQTRISITRSHCHQWRARRV
ncbi:hypothetical protein BDP27DRAFT_432432 [Rhodocollybia butyracea]|uniref:Uncharacterized protein n=1 Tax=Rhodocollybia butyracea TaxID=206335 RepID=A0A9P5PB75_9AGAR|nr:hypothetical protein BDP27DRAFT_432432 [Rhodocollybia butyracea]